MAIYKSGVAIKVRYAPPDFLTGQTCEMEVFDEVGDEIGGSPFAMAELDDGAATPTLLGVYEASFTPDAQGFWYVICSYDSGNGKTAKTYKIEGHDIDDLGTDLDTIIADTNELQTDWTNGGRLDLLIDAIKAATDNLPGDPADQSAIEAAITSAHSTTDGLITTVDTVVDGIQTDLSNGTDGLGALKAAIDAVSGGGMIL